MAATAAPCLDSDSSLSMSSQAIALSAYRTALARNTNGWCFSAVAQALKPFGVVLSGESAYQAEGQLRKDNRFMPLVINDAAYLKRGDIIVYNRSQLHKHGHIAVYQGDYKEASDHLSALTRTKEYGAATVFRLASELPQAFTPGSPRYPKVSSGGISPFSSLVRKCILKAIKFL